MTVLDFQPSTIPEGSADATPETDAPEYSCEVCGKEIFYGGRGRKPKRCADHKRSGSSSPKTKGGNATLAASAADALCQWNGLAAVGLMVTGFPSTASELSGRESIFREQAYAALITDPALCRTILRAGSTSGKLSLVMAYMMLGVSVAPAAITEYKDKRDAKREEMEAAA